MEWDMNGVLRSIESIQKTLEREVEWPLTDTVDAQRVRKHVREINTQLNFLKLLVEVESV